jgi:hypothetical protein
MNWLEADETTMDWLSNDVEYEEDNELDSSSINE